MEGLVRRGMLHIIGQMPTREPTNISPFQHMYYSLMNGKEIKDKKFNDIKNDTGVIENDDDLWLATVYRCKNILRNFVSANETNKDKFIAYVNDNDVFEFMKLKEALVIMMQRREEEKAYFNTAKAYYIALVKLTKERHPLYFFSLTSDMLIFIRTQLGIDIAEYELSPVAYEVYKSKDYSAIGIHPSLHDCESLIYTKLLEMSVDIDNYFNKRRKHTEVFLNTMDMKFINTTTADGIEVVDYPWFMLKYESIQDDFVKIVPVDSAKPFETVYKSKIEYKVIEEDGKKCIQVRNYPVVCVDVEGQEDHIEKFLEYFGLK